MQGGEHPDGGARRGPTEARSRRQHAPHFVPVEGGLHAAAHHRDELALAADPHRQGAQGPRRPRHHVPSVLRQPDRVRVRRQHAQSVVRHHRKVPSNAGWPHGRRLVVANVRQRDHLGQYRSYAQGVERRHRPAAAHAVRAHLDGALYAFTRQQSRQRFPGRDAARLGRQRGHLSARARRPPGGGALRPVRRPAGSVRRVRLHGQGVEPRAAGVSAHAAGPHQPGLLAAV
uniref:(northern house mosquito) hypothetical protein n=1 Tax=Culex pipiens TaxID=7175 RepID=A0A8D8EYA3_CULPI